MIAVSCNDHQRQLKDLLESLERQAYPQVERIVVLNNYSPELIVNLKKDYPKFQFLSNKQNLLFCPAQNQGIGLSHGEFVLCLNDDLILDEGFLAAMVKAAKSDPRIGMVSGCILRQDRETVDSTGLFLAKSRKPLERGYGQNLRMRFRKPEYVFGVGGAAAFFRRNMLEEIKLESDYFDEDYGIFYEDLDICWRAQNRNWRGYYTPAALAYHKRGGTVRQVRPRPAFLGNYNLACLSRELKLGLIRNRYRTIIKNDSLKSFLLNLPWFLGYELRLWLYLILFEPILAWLVWRDLSFLSSAWQKRKIIRAHFA
ncbi:glycosyltransferase family 2 protein [Candidatus Omnitrophota bacterium]